MGNPRPRRRRRIVDYVDKITLCGVELRRITLPNGKRVFEEEGVRALLLEATEAPTVADRSRVEDFMRPQLSH